MKPSWTQLLHVDAIRNWVARWRWRYYVRWRKQLRTLESGSAAENTVAHNIKGMGDLSVRRSLVLIRPLVTALTIAPPDSSIERARLGDLRVLSIGPRTEGELLNLFAHGFSPGCVRGLDLISYSPWVDLGDMHAMPYPDNSWDAVVCGWVLAYSDDKARAAAEIVRVAKPGAIVAIGVEYCCLDNEQQLARYGYLAGSKERLTSLSQILGYFGDHVGEVYFRHDVTERRRHEEVVAMVAVFAVRK